MPARLWAVRRFVLHGIYGVTVCFGLSWSFAMCMICNEQSVTFHFNHAVSYHHLLALIKKSQLKEGNGYHKKKSKQKKSTYIFIKKCTANLYTSTIM